MICTRRGWERYRYQIVYNITNFPATFQKMINKILQDSINTREVASFINDVIVEIKKKEGHDDVVEEVVKRLVGNDLYMKPEKCR